jgi:hypothetical protein
VLECKAVAPVVKLLLSFHFTLLMKHSYFFQNFLSFCHDFFKATNRDPTEKRQRNGRPVTVTVASLQLGTVLSNAKDAP